ncbi:HD domain-containing protein [Actinospica robiniae]|uniref:HD domain-containing protein n=1 Tax=Actinospica robiniae TaxID=304901 RepID=UPI000556CF9E|nr:HD domain-containing protein [Actinospica robiniae]
MTSIPAFPDTPAAQHASDYVRACVTESVANHSFRCYLFAMLIAERDGMQPGSEFDPELLFLACVLHDLGTSPEARGGQRFELDGADMAAELLTRQGFGAKEVDVVWEAIALHSTPTIPERRGPIAALTRRGVGMDFGVAAEIVKEDQAVAIHARFPRLRMASSLADVIARHAARAPENAPPLTIAAEIVQGRAKDPDGLSGMERMALASRWGS